jgi:hypothetical protein
MFYGKMFQSTTLEKWRKLRYIEAKMILLLESASNVGWR